jgi:hypothetical protein
LQPEWIPCVEYTAFKELIATAVSEQIALLTPGVRCDGGRPREQ